VLHFSKGHFEKHKFVFIKRPYKFCVSLLFILYQNYFNVGA